ncbi:MAG: DNA repair protein RecO [Planctomycetes bacterium]|nr:DNA repair protein RecO [Planctomycetota bacterium]
MPNFTDRALLLKRTPFGESSLVVQALTERHGRVGILAKGAYRSTSRFFAVLDLVDTLELDWQSSPRAELCTLREGSIAVRRAAIPCSPRAFRAAASVLELTDITSRAGQPEPELFALAEGALDRLQRGTEGHDAVLARFELGLLRVLGLPPALESCAACAGEAAPVDAAGTRAAFSAGAGGRLCRACAEEARASGRRVGTLPLAVLADAQRLGQPDATSSPARLVKVRDFVERFLGYHLSVRPKSHASFLASPNRNAPESAE